MSGIAFATLKTAIQQWVVLGSGLASDHVVWSPLRDTQGNPIPRPAGAFISLRLAGVRAPGFDDQSIYTVDDMSNVMSQTVVGPRILVLFIQAFQGIPTGGNEFDPLRLLSDTLTSLDRDEVAAILLAAKIDVGTYDDPQTVPESSNQAKGEVRAYTTCKLHIGSNISFAQPVPAIGWISDVTATGTLTTEKGSETVTVHVTDS